MALADGNGAIPGVASLFWPLVACLGVVLLALVGLGVDVLLRRRRKARRA
jgi:hypothetical protein